jgi:HlyD family secretion protein
VDETAMARLAPGQPARVVFRAEPDQTYQAEVLRLGRRTDKETREFVVDVRVRQLPANWAVGQRAEVYMETDRKERTLVLPQELIRWRQDQAGVLVMDRGKARWQPVELGLKGRDAVEIRNGLEPGQVVLKTVVSPGRELKENQRVYIP